VALPVAVSVILKRYGWKALGGLVEMVGLEKVLALAWRWLLNVTGTHPDRRRAIRKAKEIDGQLGSALIGQGVHWVVFMAMNRLPRTRPLTETSRQSCATTAVSS